MSHDAPSPSPEGDNTSVLFRTLFNRQRWAQVPRQTLFLLSALPLALFVPVTTIALVSVGAGLAVLGVGFLLLLAAAGFSRWFGRLELQRLIWAGALPIEAPDWPELSGQPLGKRLRLVLLDPKQWSYIAYAALYLIVGTVSGSLALVWVASIFNGATRWIWNGWAGGPDDLTVIGWSLPGPWMPPAFLHGPLTVLAYTVLGGVALVTLPWFTRTMVALHDRLARVFLGRYSPEEMDAQMEGLRRSRRASVAAEGRTLWRLERDLHDGPQQQLLRLQLDLAAARRKMATDPQAAAELIEDAGRRSAETLSELRHLVRGMAPPLLQDRGLVAALEALAERSPIPTTIQAALDNADAIEPAVQQGVYFVVAELLANAVKHSDAGRMSVDCTLAPGSGELVVTVIDDGQGGASVVPGHGLAGIAERVEGLGGRLAIHSPKGGPTRVTLNIPA